MYQREHPSYETVRELAERDPRYSAYLQPEDRPAVDPPVPGKPRITYRVRKAGCGRKCRWLWVVLVDGMPTESGECETKDEAQAAAKAEADSLTASLA